MKETSNSKLYQIAFKMTVLVSVLLLVHPTTCATFTSETKFTWSNSQYQNQGSFKFSKDQSIVIFMKDYKQITVKYLDESATLNPTVTLANTLNPDDLNFETRAMSCATEMSSCIVTSSSGFFKVDFTSSLTTFEQIESRDSTREFASPTDVQFVPRTNFFLMRVPEWNSIQRWTLDDMSKYAKIDSTYYSDMFLSTIQDGLYFFGY